MAARSHLSIGEVLSLVQEDFPDVTISKIRFLESQGLLDPERTPSGYRKFYRSDIDRLQWILTQQRDNFLPLKVIRERLDEWDATGHRPEGVEPPTASDAEERDAPTGADTDDASASTEAAQGHEPEDPRRAAASLAAASAVEVMSHQPTPEAEPSRTTSAGSTPERPPSSDAESARGGPTSTSLTAEELAAACDVSVAVVNELESYAMIESRRIGADSYYEPAAKAVVEACRSFLDHGVEVRHLRMYKIAAEREAGVLEQLIMPLLKQRNPDARARAVETVRELAEVGETLHAALLRHALRDTLP